MTGTDVPADLPRSSEQHPATRLLRALRPPAGWLVRRRWRVRVHGDDRVPARGGVILAANHVGIIDGPLLAVLAPRPVHALTKLEMFEGRLGGFLRRTGQVPLDRYHPDPGAVRSCLRVLRDGGVVGIFPEGTRGDGELHRFHHGAAYLALVSGAPVVPVTMIGTRPPGGGSNALPERGGAIDVVFGRPWHTTQQPWPRTREQVGATSVLLWGHMLSELDSALSQTRRSLPGPLPAGQSEDDPDTGLVEHRREL
ncbi:lysophospholipid acyltransferase family protein [Nocardioides sp. S-58]|uniref:Lysophospholipid acyltransferase family protein n=1 Tax=Nocardioides renjunii TaxID=3095075 RepID=A0ABU5KBK7_9ACTN|nr:lysophospholipid acyltransferase family protein [Nocardioides sp. S-58]MDZ5662312.1 lysophospholipid acyltransferase family protein [Nocardioides sp. S-58]